MQLYRMHRTYRARYEPSKAEVFGFCIIIIKCYYYCYYYYYKEPPAQCEGQSSKNMDFGSEKIEDWPVASSLEGYVSPYFTYYVTMLVPLVGEVWAPNSH